MDRCPEILALLKERGPMTVKGISRATGLAKRLVNGALHGSKNTCKVERSPFSTRNKKPIWSWSSRPIRPVKQIKVRKVNESEDSSSSA